MTPEEKTAVMKEYALHEGDTGSPEVQIAVLTKRGNDLTEHLKSTAEAITHAAGSSKWSTTDATCWHTWETTT